ncbi:DapH/DapD/GlmU-related protein [Robinsoniella peoriensis]
MIPAPIHIGQNVWVGSNATILSSVTIGDGAVIAAGGSC